MPRTSRLPVEEMEGDLGVHSSCERGQSSAHLSSAGVKGEVRLKEAVLRAAGPARGRSSGWAQNRALLNMTSAASSETGGRV